MKVWNRGGYYNISYDFLEVTVANVPDTPDDAPVSDASVTDWTKLRLTYEEPYSGGSVLTNYEMIIDDGLGGGYQTIAGGDVNTHLDTFILISRNISDAAYHKDIRRGLIYRVRYRAQNVVGWSEYSPVTYIKAARKPDAP
jgi:hypothetical protein